MTGGISIFAPSNFFGKLTRDLNLFKFNRQNPVLCDETISEDVQVQEWLQVMKQAYKDKQIDDTKISAEYSMVAALFKQNRLAKNTRVKLVHTNTLGGKIAAMLLQYVLAERFCAYVHLNQRLTLTIRGR